MAAANQALTSKGKNHTRGWTGRKWVKRQMHKKIRREAKIDPDLVKNKYTGYCW